MRRLAAARRTPSTEAALGVGLAIGPERGNHGDVGSERHALVQTGTVCHEVQAPLIRGVNRAIKLPEEPLRPDPGACFLEDARPRSLQGLGTPLKATAAGAGSGMITNEIQALTAMATGA